MDRKTRKGPATHTQLGVSGGDGPETTCGQLLRRYRSLTGLTQEELAERCGYSANYVGKLERDERTPPPAALDCLATTLGLGQEDRALLGAAGQRRGGRDVTARRLVG